MKITEFIKEYWWQIFSIILIVVIAYWALRSLSGSEIADWRARPIQSMTIGDIAILVLIHAWISRSDIKVNK